MLQKKYQSCYLSELVHKNTWTSDGMTHNQIDRRRGKRQQRCV